MSKLNKIIITIFLLFLIFLPTNIFALSSDYKDVVHEIVGEKEVKDKVTIYFFHGYSCPHCKEETGFLDQLEKKYDGKILIRKYETWKEENKQNAKWANEVRHHFGITREGVPLTVVGEKYYSGYSDVIGYRIEKQIDLYLAEEESDDDQEKTIVESNKYKIPILGEIDVTKASIFLIAVVLGFIDGFNPCAMWVLLFIINMLLGMEDKKKMFILGFAFLFTSAFIYFLSMLGISFVLGNFTGVLRSLIGVVGIVLGSVQLYNYYQTRNREDGCVVVDKKKRKNITRKITSIKESRNFFLALIGVISLAVSVNLVELACSLGFPATFSEILTINNVDLIMRIVYLLIYVFMYMLDDIVVFIISMSTLSLVGMTTKYNKLVKLIGGIIMILMGILLIFKPEWIMLRF